MPHLNEFIHTISNSVDAKSLVTAVLEFITYGNNLSASEQIHPKWNPTAMELGVTTPASFSSSTRRLIIKQITWSLLIWFYTFGTDHLNTRVSICYLVTIDSFLTELLAASISFLSKPFMEQNFFWKLNYH